MDYDNTGLDETLSPPMFALFSASISIVFSKNADIYLEVNGRGSRFYSFVLSFEPETSGGASQNR